MSQLRRRGAEEPVLPKTKPKMGNGEARAALRGVLSLCLGRKLLWLPEIRASGGFFLSFLLKCACASGLRGALCAAPSARRQQGRHGRGQPSSQHPRSSQYPLLGPQSPRWAPTPLRTRAGAWACCPRPRGVSRTPQPLQCLKLREKVVGVGLSTCGS